MVVFFIYPGRTKKTKINAHELEALRFILRFLLTVTNTQRTHTSAGESRGLRLAACLHPRALRASTPGSSARGRAQRQRTSRFLGADSHSKVRDLLQTGASSVCVCAIRYACAIIRYACASSDMHVTSSDMHVPSSVIYMYSSVPGHRNWQIETAAWIWPSFFHCALETRWLGVRKTCGIGLFYRNYRPLLQETGWLVSDFISVCLETRWLGQKKWFLCPGTTLYTHATVPRNFL